MYSTVIFFAEFFMLIKFFQSKKNGDFIENILEKKLIFFLAIFTFFMAALDAQRNFMPTRYIFFLSISFGSKVIAFFVKKLPKLNILSVIAID